MKKQPSTSYLVQLSLLAAVEILLAFTPLGFIPLGITNATTLHIPVILGGILLGPVAGAVLGGVFGATSIVINTIRPTATSFVFSPFYMAAGFSGGWRSLVVALLPRILVGVVAAYVFRLALRLCKQRSFVAAAITGVVGSLTNTVLVLSGIYFLFGQAYAQVRNVPFEVLVGLLMGIVTMNGLPEAIVAGLLTAALAKTLLGLRSRVVNR